MHYFQILSVLLGLVFLSNALPQTILFQRVTSFPPRTAVKQSVSAADATVHQDFLISDFFAVSHSDETNTVWNRSLSFRFADPNSNTSTSCSYNWTKTANSSTAPAGPSYVVCDPTHGTAKPEFFDWHFASYTALNYFTIELAHDFSDPKNYPPPYDYVEYFATANVSLTCGDAAGVGGCTLPHSKSPLHAPIYAVSN